MKKSPKTLRTGAAALAALLMTLAAGLDMTAARKLNPDAVDAGGFLYQLIGRTSRSFTLEPLAATCVLLLAFWLARRYLLRRAEGAKAGEYLLSAFLGGIALLCAAMRAGETVRLIWQNSFQLFKSLLIFAGMSLWFLYAVRVLAEGLSRPRKEGRFCAFWDRHPFGFPFLVLLAAYGWQIAIKYPGVIHLDVVMPIRMVLGLSPKNNTFPPTGTLLYGGAFLLGEKLGNVNWTYFAIMLFQSVSLMLTLSYALWLMHTRKAPRWVQLLALTLFAVNPIYIGWITTLGKDAQYMVWMLLMGVLMMEFLAEPEAFCRKKSRWVLLTADSLLAVLTRYNGVSVVVPCLVAILIVLCRRPALRRNIPCLLVCSALAFGLSAGANAAATRLLGLEEIRFYDYLSIPFQQTARVAKFYGGDGVTDEEKAAVDTMIAYDQLAERYDPAHADGVKTTVDVLERGKNSPKAYLCFWWKQLRQYPVDYLDAMLNVNYWMLRPAAERAHLSQLRGHSAVHLSLRLPRDAVLQSGRDSPPDELAAGADGMVLPVRPAAPDREFRQHGLLRQRHDPAGLCFMDPAAEENAAYDDSLGRYGGGRHVLPGGLHPLSAARHGVPAAVAGRLLPAAGKPRCPLPKPGFRAIIAPRSGFGTHGNDEDKRPMHSDSQRGRQELRVPCCKPSELAAGNSLPSFSPEPFSVRGNGQAPLQAKSASALRPVRNLGGNTRRSGLVP